MRQTGRNFFVSAACCPALSHCPGGADVLDEVGKTTAADLFSLHIVKETEQIAKLARSLKSRAKSAWART